MKRDLWLKERAGERSEARSIQPQHAKESRMKRRTLTIKTPVSQHIPVDDIIDKVCENCRFFDDISFGDDPKMLCRKKAPYRHFESGEAVWPSVYRADWCGDFKRLPVE